jgi:hypothetical protein
MRLDTLEARWWHGEARDWVLFPSPAVFSTLWPRLVRVGPTPGPQLCPAQEPLGDVKILNVTQAGGSLVTEHSHCVLRGKTELHGLPGNGIFSLWPLGLCLPLKILL